MCIRDSRITPLDSTSLRDRRKMGWGGLVFATIAVDAKGRIYGTPQITVEGLLEEHETEEWEELLTSVEDAVKRADKVERIDDKKLSERIRISLRRQINDICGKRPKVSVHLVRI